MLKFGNIPLHCDGMMRVDASKQSTKTFPPFDPDPLQDVKVVYETEKELPSFVVALTYTAPPLPTVDEQEEKDVGAV